MIKLLFAFVVSVSLLTACSDDKPNNGQEYVEIAGKCEFQPTDGGAAEMSNATRSNFKTYTFGKAYNRSILDAVLTSSGVNTVAFVKSLGVNLFKIPRSEKSETKKLVSGTYFENVAAAPDECKFFQSLPEPSDKKIAAIWEEASGGINEGSLAGLYFEYPGSGVNKANNPHILVDEQTGRYTLVHELMHHNYNLGRKREVQEGRLLPVEKLMARIEAASTDLGTIMQTYERDKTKSDVDNYVKRLELFIKDLIAFNAQNALEEVGVEGLLIEEYAKGSLKFVSSPGYWYLEMNVEKGLALVDSIGAKMDSIYAWPKDIAKEKFYTDITPKVEEIEKLFKDHRAEIAAALDKAKVQTKGVKKIDRYGINGNHLHGPQFEQNTTCHPELDARAEKWIKEGLF